MAAIAAHQAEAIILAKRTRLAQRDYDENHCDDHNKTEQCSAVLSNHEPLPPAAIKLRSLF